MANQRREGQTFIGFQADSRLVGKIDEARKKLREDRSLFVRVAIAEKLQKLGYAIPEEWILPPMRDVKDVMLNEQPHGTPVQIIPERQNVIYSKPKKAPGARH